MSGKGGRPNWFIGLPVAPGSWFAERVCDPPDGVWLFHPQDLHLTVAFLGAVDEHAAAEAWALAGGWPGGPVDASLARVVPMGHPSRASALSALLDAGRDAVVAGINALQGPMLEAARRPPETRGPKPHLTVARIGRRADRTQRVAAFSWAGALDLSGVECQVDTIALYTWSDERPRRQFRIVESRSLTPLVPTGPPT